MTVETKRFRDRRVLTFVDLDDVLADVERLDRAGGESIRASGNWTPAQIVQHVAKLIEFSMDGFPGRAPWYLRVPARLMKGRFLTKALPTGLKFPSGMSFLAPEDDVTWPVAIQQLRTAVERAGGSRMTKPSPLLGPMSHEDWVALHCRHAEMHFSFMRVETER
jgi:hypothetical protein